MPCASYSPKPLGTIPPIAGPVNCAKKRVTGSGDGVGVRDGVGVCEAVGDGVGGAVNVPVRIVAAAFRTESVLPAMGVGTVPPPVVVKLRMPRRVESSVIVPMLVVFRKTPRLVPAGRFTL